jgi:hypothetical protein
MSSDIPTPEHSADGHFPTTKSQRVLSCVLCSQRKVKCDRKFPCTNCSKASAQCVPASSVPRQRRRRFPERELLDRLRLYEDLLKKHKIPFQPLHVSSVNSSSISDEKPDTLERDRPPAGMIIRSTELLCTATGYPESGQAKYVSCNTSSKTQLT